MRFKPLKKLKMAQGNRKFFWNKIWPFRSKPRLEKTGEKSVAEKEQTPINLKNIGPIEISDPNYVKKVYGGESIHRAISRSEIVFGRHKTEYLDFQKSLLDPTLISPEDFLTLPEAKDLPPNIPPHSMFNLSDEYDSQTLVFPPKPLQEAHEHFLFSSFVPQSSGNEILSPQNRFNLYIDRIFESVSRAGSGNDLAEILKCGWLSPNALLSSKLESVRRTLEVFHQLGQIKQFAFLNSKELDWVVNDMVIFCDRSVAAMNTDELADAFWCFAKLGVRPASVVKRMVAKVESRLGEFTMDQLSDIFYAFEELRIESVKTETAVEKSIIENSPRSLRELSALKLFQLSYAVIMGSVPQNPRKNVVWHLCRQINEMWKTRPFVPLHSMLQICRFTTAVNLFFPGEKFKGLVPNDLREKALFLFKSGRVEMYSPPFVDPMARETAQTHYATMRSRQSPMCTGVNGWWLWSFDRRNPPFSLEPASRTWYTRLDDRRRMTGACLLRNRVIERHGVYTLHLPFYEWDVLTTPKARLNYFYAQMAEQLGITSPYKDTVLAGHLAGGVTRGRDLRTEDKEIKKDDKIAWDWVELCEINAAQGIDPNVYLNDGNFQVPRGVYDDEDKFKKPDYWND